ncbi:hypothetical protein SCHPADRAFT_457893 [Schizopora paradoxa]|uniref:Uncharacterized protein n=1 Tax=Schizopora paradoxa TaxID=27342 RepID=A0A0H2RIT4_9AGAM|nr:hypothetical protein SCHPADRAFT_457893 [Schizopora paradoxa]
MLEGLFSRISTCVQLRSNEHPQRSPTMIAPSSSCTKESFKAKDSVSILPPVGLCRKTSSFPRRARIRMIARASPTRGEWINSTMHVSKCMLKETGVSFSDIHAKRVSLKVYFLPPVPEVVWVQAREAVNFAMLKAEAGRFGSSRHPRPAGQNSQSYSPLWNSYISSRTIP